MTRLRKMLKLSFDEKAVLLMAALLALAFGAILEATPVNVITVFVTGTNYTAGVSTNTTSPGQVQITCFRPGTLPPDEVETVSLTLMKDGVPLADSISPSSFNTSVGVVSYLFGIPVTFYYAGTGLQLRATSSGGTQGINATAFTVNPSSPARIIALAPGMSHVPGTNPTLSGNTGRSGSAILQEPGVTFPLTVILTDISFNKVSQSHAVSFASGDLIQVPLPGSLTAGTGSFNTVITGAKTSRTITVTDTSDASVLPGTVEVTTIGPPEEEIFPFPSPFNPKLGETITFRFRITSAASATVKVKDMFGQGIWEKALASGVGTTDVVWDGRNENGALVTAGVYYAILELDGSVKSKKKFGVIK